MTSAGKATITGLVLAASGLVLTPNAAHAQNSVPVQKPFSLKLGAGFADSRTLLDLGVAYDFGKSTGTNPLLYQAYVDYYTKDGLNIFGYGVALKYLAGSPLASAHPYVGLGIGGYSFNGSGNTDTKFGGKLFAGYQLNSGIFGEVDYAATGDSDINPIGVRVGFRF